MLHLTRPAVSRSLGELEQILGVRLFDRHPKGMSVSAGGGALIAHAQFVVAEVGSLIREADEVRTGAVGEVRVGALLAGTADVLPAAILEVARLRPDTQISVVEAGVDRLYEQLMLGAWDLVVGRVVPLATMRGVELEQLYEDSVQVICAPSHPRSTHRGSLGELVGEQWILPPSDTSLRRQIEESFIADCGRPPQAAIECVSALPLRPLVLGGEHLAVVPSGVFRDDLDRGALVALPVTIRGSDVPVGVMVRAGAGLTSGATALVEALRHAARPADAF